MIKETMNGRYFERTFTNTQIMKILSHFIHSNVRIRNTSNFLSHVKTIGFLKYIFNMSD